MTLRMSRPVVLGCLLLAACEPVLLVADEGNAGVGARQSQATKARDASTSADADDAEMTAQSVAAGTAAPPPSSSPDPATPEVMLSVKAIDCGSCFDLVASGKGGVPPYQYEWEDGTHNERRRVCVGSSELEVWVVAQDIAGARSNAYVTQLQTEFPDSTCPARRPASRMCLENPSFEGTAAINTGQMFAAMPWSDCTDPSNSTANTPDIANNNLDQVTMLAPVPTNGDTYLALSTGEQASQKLCEALNAGSKTSLVLDASRIELGGPDVFLQIARSVSCSGCRPR
jgi:hypothetical protein